MLGPIGPYPYADDYKTAHANAIQFAYYNEPADEDYNESEYGSDDSTDLQWRRGDADTSEDYNAPV